MESVSILEKKIICYKLLKELSLNSDFVNLFNEFKYCVPFQLGLDNERSKLYDLDKISKLLKPISVLEFELSQYKKDLLECESENKINYFKSKENKEIEEKNEIKFKTKTKNYSEEDTKKIESNVFKKLKTGSYDIFTYPNYVTVEMGMINCNLDELNPFIHKGKYLIPKDNLIF